MRLTVPNQKSFGNCEIATGCLTKGKTLGRYGASLNANPKKTPSCQTCQPAQNTKTKDYTSAASLYILIAPKGPCI